jgi:hypothetical protein
MVEKSVTCQTVTTGNVSVMEFYRVHNLFAVFEGISNFSESFISILAIFDIFLLARSSSPFFCFAAQKSKPHTARTINGSLASVPTIFNRVNDEHDERPAISQQLTSILGSLSDS